MSGQITEKHRQTSNTPKKFSFCGRLEKRTIIPFGTGFSILVWLGFLYALRIYLTGESPLQTMERSIPESPPRHSLILRGDTRLATIWANELSKYKVGESGWNAPPPNEDHSTHVCALLRLPRDERCSQLPETLSHDPSQTALGRSSNPGHLVVLSPL